MNTCYWWSVLLMRCLLLIFCDKKIGSCSLHNFKTDPAHAGHCHLSNHNFHWLKWKWKLLHSLESWRLQMPHFLFFIQQASYWTQGLLLARHWHWLTCLFQRRKTCIYNVFCTQVCHVEHRALVFIYILTAHPKLLSFKYCNCFSHS